MLRVKAQICFTRQSSSSSDIWTTHVGSFGWASWTRVRSATSAAVWSLDMGSVTSSLPLNMPITARLSPRLETQTVLVFRSM